MFSNFIRTPLLIYSAFKQIRCAAPKKLDRFTADVKRRSKRVRENAIVKRLIDF